MNFVPQLNYVSEEQIEKLHQYGMGILKKLGMRVEDPMIRKLLCEHGCTENGDRILFTDTLIGDMLKAQKGRVTMTSAVTGMKKRWKSEKHLYTVPEAHPGSQI